MATKQVKAVLCPNASLADAPDTTWPCPAGVKVRLTNKSDPDDSPVVENESTVSLKPGADYKIAIDGPGWEQWKPAKPVLTADSVTSSKSIGLTLVPRDRNLRLVALKLSRQRPDGPPVPGATVTVTDEDGREYGPFHSRADGSVYALAPEGRVTLRFGAVAAGAGNLVPQDDSQAYQVRPGPEVDEMDIVYLAGIRVVVRPEVVQAGGAKAPLPGARVTLAYRGSRMAAAFAETNELGHGNREVRFDGLRFPGTYQITAEPPAVIDGWPVVAGVQEIRTEYLGPGADVTGSAVFEAVAKETVHGTVLTPDDMPLDADLELEFYGDGEITIERAVGTGGPFDADVPAGTALKVRLAPGLAVPTADGYPLELADPDQALVPGSDNTIALQYQHAIAGNAVDEAGHPAPYALIEVFDDQQKSVRIVTADDKGLFVAGLETSGRYFVAIHTTSGGESVTRAPVNVASIVHLRAPLVARNGGTGQAAGQFPREAFTDLASYPVLTEETATGGGFPAPGGTGGPGGGYGQTVDQVMRDVLGWRPSGDTAGFQAALAGAFQLREVAGRTEATWQQRGYSVQADMGALTGAQASIYARAKGALDQIQPLLAGLTSLNPSVSTPEEMEAIRTVVTTEITELVSELSYEGGPRIQRVNELFTMLTGQDISSVNDNPDNVRGQLSTMRQRFALTVDNVDTIEDERVLTNFRIVVEQVLALAVSWKLDRDLLSGVQPNTSLGTLLIWLSRGLEAVGDSVDELNFTLDSVFVDAAQRQVVELDFRDVTVAVPVLPLKNGVTAPVRFSRDEPPLRLADLLDWVTRAARDEGPRLVQDAGKDGVTAFAPILDKLRQFVRAIHHIARTDETLPAGLRTPRVHRALNVLAGQLDQAANLARLVQQPAVPSISAAQWGNTPQDALRPPKDDPPRRRVPGDQPRIWVALLGSNFQDCTTVVLSAQGRPDLPAQYDPVTGNDPSLVLAQFTNPGTVPGSAGTTWDVSLINNDATQSNAVEILQV